MANEDREPSTADVYAGDVKTPAASDTVAGTFRFTVLADAEPTVLVRIAGILNIANAAPLRVHMRREPLDALVAVIDLAEISVVTAGLIRRKLEQLTSVVSVSVVELPPVTGSPPDQP